MFKASIKRAYRKGLVFRLISKYCRGMRVGRDVRAAGYRRAERSGRQYNMRQRLKQRIGAKETSRQQNCG